MGEMVYERAVVRSTTERSGRIGASGKIRGIMVHWIFPRARILPRELPLYRIDRRISTRVRLTIPVGHPRRCASAKGCLGGAERVDEAG
jgi:hypothetical protein